MADRRWTREQAAAIEATRDALLVANAGTGKTTTVVAKILWLLGLERGEVEDGHHRVVAAMLTGQPVPYLVWS